MVSLLPQVTPDDARVISNALAGVYAKRLSFDLQCEQNESYDQIVSAFTKVENLQIGCREASLRSLASLLQTPTTMLTDLFLMSTTESPMDIISASLSRNIKLKRLKIALRERVSSIESIYSSNHTLEDIKLCHYQNQGRAIHTLSELAKGCLKHNKNGNKE